MIGTLMPGGISRTASSIVLVLDVELVAHGGKDRIELVFAEE